MNDEILKAIKILNQGGVVIFPTDTVYGVGCRIDNEVAVKKLFEIRKRPSSKATPVLVNGIFQALEYFENVPKSVKKIMKKYWPGALTLVYYCQKRKIPSLVRGGGETIGLRMPNLDLILSIIEGIGVPLLGPSANFHGSETPKSFEELDPEFVKKVDFVVKGETTLGISSTVLDCTKNPYEILRQGGQKLDVKDLGY